VVTTLRLRTATVLLCIVCSCSMLVPVHSQTRRKANTNAQAPGASGATPSTPESPYQISARVDRMVEAQVRKLGIPGYGLTVIHGGTIVLQKGYGFADLEAQSPVTPHTVFGLASVTKTFTSFGLLLLVDEGKIKLDDTLNHYLPELTPAWRKITIRQLASMTAGIPEGMPNEIPWPEEMKLLQERPLAFEPGTRYLYSNCSYRILGSVIEKVTGKTYMEFVRERILEPLGMRDTGPTDRQFEPPMAAPYARKPEGGLERLGGYKGPEINFSAGMLASNSVDMAKYAQALVTHKMLSPKGYELLWMKRQALPGGKAAPWAFGWESGSVAGHLQVRISGGLPGIASTVLIFPNDDLIVIGLANIGGAEPHNLTQAVARELLGADLGPDEEQPR
jgi:CubicO group peptidase (beta-lactamase class C family)